MKEVCKTSDILSCLPFEAYQIQGSELLPRRSPVKWGWVQAAQLAGNRKKWWRGVMRKLIALEQLSLDGVMQGPGGPAEDPRNGFTLGGWAMAFGDEVLGREIDKIMARKFDLLLGHYTYNIWAKYWPHETNGIAKAFNQATKYVATRGQDKLDWEKSVRLSGDVAQEVRQLKTSDGPDLHIWGSGVLMQRLMVAELIDEYRFWVCPVMLGQGKRLFEKSLPPGRFTLAESIKTSTGVLLNTYRFVGPVKPGDFA